MRPNIILILIDDLGWKDLSCYGSEFYETPNLDRLARQGMRFTDAYAACPVCSPTRASLLTGQYPARVGVTNYIPGEARGKLIEPPNLHQLPLEHVSLAKALRQAGYATWHVGKWHLGDRPHYPDNHGFDVNVGGCSWGRPMKGYFSPWGIETLADGPEGEYLTDRLTDEALNLIRNNKGRPFFLNFWHYAVHTPIQSPPELVEKYRRKAAAMGLDQLKVKEEGEQMPTERLRHRRVVRRLIQSDPDYAAMVENLDTNIGRLLTALDDSGQADNTIVIFTSDNGGLSTAESSPTCNKPLNEGKGWMYEGGVREPLIIRWPSVVAPGSTCNVPVTTPDFYPTLLEAAQLPLLPEQHMDGWSFLPLLKGDKSPDRPPIYWHYPHYGNQGGTPGSSMRIGDWKLIEFFEDGRLELYNLREDIGEAVNLASEHKDRAREMHQQLKVWREQIDAKLPRPNPEWTN